MTIFEGSIEHCSPLGSLRLHNKHREAYQSSLVTFYGMIYTNNHISNKHIDLVSVKAG